MTCGTLRSSPVLLIGAEVLPWKISVKGLRRVADAPQALL